MQTEERALYLVTGKGQRSNIRSVGRSGQQWFGRTRVVSKHIKPAWRPPASIRGTRSPDFYIESGSPRNPMGAAALVLADEELAIHGTNNPARSAASCRPAASVCTPRHHELYGRVGVGTRVVFARARRQGRHRTREPRRRPRRQPRRLHCPPGDE